MVRPEGLCYIALVSSCLHLTVSTGLPHEDPHLCAVSGCMEGFLWDPESKHTHQIPPDYFARWLGPCSLPASEREFPSSPSLTFGMAYFSYFFLISLYLSHCFLEFDAGRCLQPRSPRVPLLPLSCWSGPESKFTGATSGSCAFPRILFLDPLRSECPQLC